MRLTYLTYCPRSGSTKLAQMLAESSVVVPEFRTLATLVKKDLIANDARPAQELLKSIVSADAQLFDNLGLDDSRVDRLVEAGPGLNNIARTVVELLCERSGIEQPQSALLKSGAIVEKADAVLSSDEAAQLLFIVRDPRAVVRSMHRSKPPRDPSGSTFSNGNPYYAISMWRRRLADYERAAARFGDRVTAVRFEDLADPSELDRVRDFVGTADESLTFAVADREHDLHSNVGRGFNSQLNEQWRTDLPGWVVRDIEVLCHAELLRWGYEADEEPAAVVKLRARAMSTMSRPIDLKTRAIRRLRSYKQ